ncbi:hypothetical protein Plhal304r1_c006g0025871 [Plasmopara halstedii]
MRFASLLIRRLRSDALVVRHGPSKAVRAAVTAASISAMPASATLAIIFSVAGLMVSNLLPEMDGTNLPSIRSYMAKSTMTMVVSGLDSLYHKRRRKTCSCLQRLRAQ